MPRGRRSLGFALVYGSYLLVFVLAVDYLFFWRPFYAELRRLRPAELVAPRHVGDETMRRLGALRGDRTSAFTRFDAESRGGVRVCAFGDSFTYGDEVSDGHDFPAMLSLVFAVNGRSDVEVLNFGNPWYGFHQTYVLWDEVGRRLDCDVVLLGPDGFQPERDTTFNHTNLAYPHYLHARFTLDRHAGVRLHEVAGRTPEERFAAYFGFVPRWTYVRYDRSPPALVRALLPRGRTIANPLYYDRRSAEEEAYATYAVLLARMAADGAPVLLLHALPEVVELGQRVGSESLVAVHAPRIERYPYLAPGGHYSSFGNRWLAEHYFALLAGASGGPTELVFTDVERGNGGTRASMSSFEHVEVRLGGSAAGFLAIASADPAARGGAPADLHGSAVASLLALKGTGRSIVDAAFIPLPVPLRGGEAVVLRADGVELELGRVEMLDSPAPVGVAEIEGVELHGDVVLHLGGAAWAPAVSAAGGRTTIAVGSTEVLVAARGDGPLRFTAVREPVRGLRVGASEHVDVASLGASGTATLALREPSGRVAEVALAHWSKRSAERLTSTRFPLLTEQLSRRTSRAQ